MKKLLLILTLIVSTFAMAGADHIPGVVYTTKSDAPQYLKSLSFDAAVVSPDLRTLELKARFGNFSGDFKVTNVIFKTEDDMVITAEKVLIDEWEHSCGDMEVAVATVKAVSNITKGIDLKKMEISISYSKSRDNCHYTGMPETFKYELTK